MCLWVYPNSAKYKAILLLPLCLKYSELKEKETATPNTQQKMFGIAKYFCLQSS